MMIAQLDGFDIIMTSIIERLSNLVGVKVVYVGYMKTA
jgi:hypothetical protein